MKHLRLLLMISLVLLPALSQAADSKGYGYPIPTPYAATILGTPPQLKPPLPKEVKNKELLLELIPGLKKSEVFYYDNGLRCTFAYQDHKAPLIFLIAGTGSNHKSAKLETLMKAFWQAGYHVITLPSPTHSNFIINASHSHIPGELTEDAADLYWAMENAWLKVKDDIEVSDFYVGGYSLGATQAAFVSKLDEEKKSFNFKRVLMINPAVNLYDSVSRIEATLEKIPGGPKKVNTFFNNMMKLFLTIYEEGDYVEFNGEFLYGVYQSGMLTPEEGGGLIGIAFRIASGSMIFTSDVMTNSGYVVPKNRVLESTSHLRDYMRVSNHLSFIDYFNEYFYPYFAKKRPGLTKEALIQSLGLKSIEPYLKGNPKFNVMTNANDFILSDADRDYLKQLFGERTVIYPVGGHLGNLEYVENIKQMQEIIGLFNKEGGTK
jgi:hypothetical protein